MSEVTIFVVGSVVFVMGIAALVLYGLYEFERWDRRDASAGPTDDSAATPARVGVGDRRVAEE
jgi:hypothetical protein